MSATSCTCGCGTLVSITNAEQACGCGCGCCAPHAEPRDEEIAELQHLRDAADQRLAELDAS